MYKPNYQVRLAICNILLIPAYHTLTELSCFTPPSLSFSLFLLPLPLSVPGFNFAATVTLASEHRPSWVPDADSPTCSTCKERFSWKKRRHHCRSCGNVSDNYVYVCPCTCTVAPHKYKHIIYLHMTLYLIIVTVV